MRNITAYDLIRRRVLTEKSTALEEALGKYVFEVSPKSNKTQIKKAVEILFKVKVLSVNILQKPVKGKVFKGTKGLRSGFKKSVVTVSGGKKIQLVA